MNAIILAAGLGTRFKDITKKTHKALLPLPNGIPNIEQTIKFLINAKITDIYIVTGHLSEQFEYLKEKYNCKLIHNKHYKEYNNIYSFKCAINYFKDTFIIDSDVTLFSNIFIKKQTSSCYFTIKRESSNKDEWIPITKNNKVVEIEISNRHAPSLLGVSYWNNKDSIIIKEHINQFTNEENLKNPTLYWDNIPMKLLDILDVKIEEIPSSYAYEIDDPHEYELIFKLQTKK